MKKVSSIMLLALAALAVLSTVSCQSQPAAVAVEQAADATAAASGDYAQAPSADSISAASGKFYYEAGSYTAEQLKAALSAYPYAGSVTIATVHEDGSPNLALALPGLTADGQYLTFGLAENRTKTNMTARKLAVVSIYEYKPTAENKADRNREIGRAHV